MLSRSSSHQVDSRVKIQVVDYNSLESLVSAFSGQDAVVDVLAVGSVPLEIHLRLVEAAQKAGVQRFVPSEYGCDTTNPLTSKLPVFADKVTIKKRLEEISSHTSSFSYTSVITGPFFDWGLKVGSVLNLAGPSTTIFDGGDTPFSTTTLQGVGRAIVGVLQHPDETKNRVVYVAEAEVTQNKLLQWSGKADQIQREPVTTEDLEKQAYEAVNQSPPDYKTFAVNLIKRAIFDSQYGTLFTKLDNELLGIRKLTESEIVDVVKQHC